MSIILGDAKLRTSRLNYIRDAVCEPLSLIAWTDGSRVCIQKFAKEKSNNEISHIWFPATDAAPRMFAWSPINSDACQLFTFAAGKEIFVWCVSWTPGHGLSARQVTSFSLQGIVLGVSWRPVADAQNIHAGNSGLQSWCLLAHDCHEAQLFRITVHLDVERPDKKQLLLEGCKSLVCLAPTLNSNLVCCAWGIHGNSVALCATRELRVYINIENCLTGKIQNNGDNVDFRTMLFADSSDVSTTFGEARAIVAINGKCIGKSGTYFAISFSPSLLLSESPNELFNSKTPLNPFFRPPRNNSKEKNKGKKNLPIETVVQDAPQNDESVEVIDTFDLRGCLRPKINSFKSDMSNKDKLFNIFSSTHSNLCNTMGINSIESNQFDDVNVNETISKHTKQSLKTSHHHSGNMSKNMAHVRIYSLDQTSSSSTVINRSNSNSNSNSSNELYTNCSAPKTTQTLRFRCSQILDLFSGSPDFVTFDPLRNELLIGSHTCRRIYALRLNPNPNPNNPNPNNPEQGLDKEKGDMNRTIFLSKPMFRCLGCDGSHSDKSNSNDAVGVSNRLKGIHVSRNGFLWILIGAKEKKSKLVSSNYRKTSHINLTDTTRMKKIISSDGVAFDKKTSPPQVGVPFTLSLLRMDLNVVQNNIPKILNPIYDKFNDTIVANTIPKNNDSPIKNTIIKTKKDKICENFESGKNDLKEMLRSVISEALKPLEERMKKIENAMDVRMRNLERQMMNIQTLR